jgi:uncharacterized protein (TIGR03437 family)
MVNTMRRATKTVLTVAAMAAAAYGQTGAFTLNGGTDSQSGKTYAATAADQSAIYVLNGGKLTLTSPVVTKSGNTSDTTKSSQYGLNAGILVNSAGSVTISGGAISTAASGANGLFASGSGSAISMSNGTIATTGTASHGVDVTYGGSITLTDVTVTSAGDSASAGLSTDFGGGTVTAANCTVTTEGSKSPALYSTGTITVTNSVLVANGGPGGVIDGANAISITNTPLTGKTYGIRAFRSAQGSGTATITVNGGSVTSGSAVFYVTANTGLSTTAAITARGGALLRAGTGNLVEVDTSSTATFTAIGETLTGNLVADSTSKLTANLQSATTLSGTITRAALSLDATSIWKVSGNSTLTGFTDPDGISGSAITNVVGNGNTVYYDAALAANSYLKSGIYSLAGGGVLAPTGAVVAAAPSIGGVASAATGETGVAPGAWISIYGSNLAANTASATAANLVAGYLPTTLGGTRVTINGSAAYLNYVSADQLNVQAPDDSATGTVPLTVTTSSGSASFNIAMQRVMPGIFTAASYVLAVRASDSAIINGTGTATPGYTTSAAANPGDVLSIYATGLGATAPAAASGLVFSGRYYELAELPAVTVGGAKADVSFAGLVGAGLYQINLKVPANLAAGTYPVVITAGGVSSPTSAVLRIAGT